MRYGMLEPRAGRGIKESGPPRRVPAAGEKEKSGLNPTRSPAENVGGVSTRGLTRRRLPPHYLRGRSETEPAASRRGWSCCGGLTVALPEASVARPNVRTQACVARLMGRSRRTMGAAHPPPRLRAGGRGVTARARLENTVGELARASTGLYTLGSTEGELDDEADATGCCGEGQRQTDRVDGLRSRQDHQPTP